MKYLYILLIFLISSCDQPQQPDSKGFDSSKRNEEKLAIDYLFRCLKGGKRDKAMQLLNQVIDPSHISSKAQSHLKLLKSFGVSKNYIDRKFFTELDAFFLTQSLMFKEIANDLQKNDEFIRSVYEQVRSKVKGTFKEKDQSAFPIHIWQRGYGVCDRQSWVLAEIAYQGGADSYIIYFIDNETGLSQHTISEIDYNDETYIVDPLYGKFLKGKKFSDLSSKDIEEIWSDHPELFGDHEKAIIYSPIMAQDYTARFSVLGNLLKEVLGEQAPRVGENPTERASRREKRPGERFQYWDYPARLLLSMKIYQSENK